MTLTRSFRWPMCLACLCFCVVWSSAAQNANVTVDDQPTTEQRVQEVLELRKAKRYAEASDLIQELIASARFKLVSLGDGTYADAGRWASDALLRDPGMRRVYVERFDASASRLLAQARLSDTPLPELMDVYRLYGATPAGFAAGLDAAGLLLARGQADSAAGLIGELMRHPDSGTVLTRLTMLQGAAAAYLQDGGALDEARQALSDLDAGVATELVELAASIEAASVAVHPSRIDMGPTPISIRAPLWDRPLATSDHAGRWLQDDRLVTPAVTPSLVLVNNGRQVVAMDRASGQRAWAAPVDEDSAVTQTIRAQRWSDPRGVARQDGRVAAILGESHGITERRNPFVPPNTLACVDEQTGRLLWQRVAGEFRDDEPTRADDRRVGRLNLQNTHFTGTPLISQGVVYAVLRRTSSEADTQSSWLLAYDAKTGSLLWYRHLALVSLSYTNADSMRVSPHLSIHGDTLYFSDSLGTVGAIDRDTGGYRWLRVMPVGSNDIGSLIASTRGITGPPIVTAAGLMVPVSLSSDRLVLLDPADGSVLRSFKLDPQLSKTQYLLETSGGVLAVSQTAVSYWDADKGSVAWTFALNRGELLSGKGDVSLRFAVLPTSQRMVVLDLATGDLLDEAPAVKGRVIVRDREVLAVSDGRVHAYTSWERVYDRLVEQVQSRPDDPTAGLSLAMIAMRQDDQQASVLQGVGHALDAVARQPMRRRVAVASHVFEQLRVLIPQTNEASLREALYQRLALVTQTAAQEAAMHLDAGLYFAEQGQTRRAVDHLHAVLAEPVFAAASYEMDRVVRPAGTVARNRLQSLIEQFGRGVYARQDALARAHVADLRARADLDPASLVAVARRFPLSPVAGQLLLDAADARLAQGRTIAAESLYKQAYLRAVDDAQTRLAAGRLLSFYIEAGRRDSATTFLAHFTRTHPQMQPSLSGQALTNAQWLVRIDGVQVATPDLRPLAANMGTPIVLPGRLIATSDARPLAQASGRLLLRHDNNSVSCRVAADPSQPIWTATIPATPGPVHLLADHPEQVLLWMPADAQLVALDAQTGERLWQTTATFDASEQGKPGDAVPGELLTAVSRTTVCIGHRGTAEIVAIDRAMGTVLWRTSLDVAALTALDADDWSLAAVGRTGQPGQLRSGKLSVVSLTDAQPLLFNGQANIALTPLGVHLDQERVTVVGASGVMCLQIPNGQTLWSRRMTQRTLTGVFAVSDQRIAIQTTDGEVHLVDAGKQGVVRGSVLVRGRGDLASTHLQAAAGQLWCRSSKSVFRFGQERLLDWSDALQEPDLALKHLVVGGDHAAIVATRGDARDAFELILFESDGGRLAGRYTVGPLTDPQTPLGMQQFGQGLAVAFADQTMVILPGALGNE